MRRTSATILVICVLCTAAFGAGKTAYINMDKVFNGYYKTVNENIGFENQRRAFLEGMNLRREEYQTTVNDFRKAQTEIKNELLSTEARDKARARAQALAQRLEQKQAEIMQYRNSSMASIEEKQQQAIETLTQELLSQIQTYAKKQGIELLTDVSGKTMNRLPTVLLYPVQDEITDQIIGLVNAGHEKERDEAQKKLDEVRKQNLEEMKRAGKN